AERSDLLAQLVSLLAETADLLQEHLSLVDRAFEDRVRLGLRARADRVGFAVRIRRGVVQSDVEVGVRLEATLLILEIGLDGSELGLELENALRQRGDRVAGGPTRARQAGASARASGC